MAYHAEHVVSETIVAQKMHEMLNLHGTFDVLP